MARFVVNGSNVTVIFEYTAPIAKVQTVIGDASHHLWNSGNGDHGTPENPISWESLTNQQKLNIVDTFMKNSILSIAREYRLLSGRLLSDEQLEAILSNEHDLG